MKYNISLDEKLEGGFVLNVERTPNFFERLLFEKNETEKYIVGPIFSDELYVQKVGTEDHIRLFNNNDRTFVDDLDFDVTYRANKFYQSLFWKAQELFWAYSLQDVVEEFEELKEVA